MLDHISIKVRDLANSKEFYLKALKPLGYGIAMEFGPAAGFGMRGKPDFWIAQAEGQPSAPVHVAFACDTRAPVDAFYEAAVAAGGRDNGPPGVREHYHPSYYGAFVFDPDGNNIEAVCHVAVAPKAARKPAKKAARKPVAKTKAAGKPRKPAAAAKKPARKGKKR